MSDPKDKEDPGEDFNVRLKHGQIWREYDEPWELYKAIPPWLKHCIYVPLIMWAIWYLLVYSGGFESDNYYEGRQYIPTEETTQ